MVKGGFRVELGFLEDVAAARYHVDWGRDGDLPRASELNRQYAGLELGLVDEADHRHWAAADLRRQLDHGDDDSYSTCAATAVSCNGRHCRPGRCASPAANNAKLSRKSSSGQIPLRAASNLPKYCVSPSYTQSSSPFIGCSKSGVASPTGRRYLPFHEWTNSCGMTLWSQSILSQSTQSRGFKKSKLRDVTFVAWELPFLERNGKGRSQRWILGAGIFALAYMASMTVYGYLAK